MGKAHRAQDEHPLIADLIDKHESGELKDDREPTTRRILHSCGHESDDTVWGSYRLEDRFEFAARAKCPVCMQYDSWRKTGSLPEKPNAPIRKLWLFGVMENIIESHDIAGAQVLSELETKNEETGVGVK
jgi:hypothetical protein